MSKTIHINEAQRKVLKEYLDKEYGMPLYRFLQGGNKIRHDERGYLSDSKELVPFFFFYILKKADNNEWDTFRQFISHNQLLSKHFSTVSGGFMGRDIEVVGSKKSLSDYVKENRGGLYRIFAFTEPVSAIWKNFMWWYKRRSFPTQIGDHGNLDSTTVLYNPRVASTRWLIHFTPKEENALDILQNGFTRGVPASKLKNLAFTNNGSISDEDKEGGVYSFAYDVEDVLRDTFVDKYKEMGYDEKPFETNFDMKVWSNAIHYAVMFQASGVKVNHMTDQDEQVIFNNRTAKNFLMLRFVWDKGAGEDVMWWEVVNRNKQPLYQNKSISRVIGWVVTNYAQYHKSFLRESRSIDDGYYGGVNCTLNFDEDYYTDYLEEKGLQDSPETKKKYAEENCEWDVDYLDGETWHVCDYRSLTFDEMLSDFGENLANDILNDCMDEQEHSFEFSCYKDLNDVDINNPASLNAAAKKVMGKVDSPCGKFRGWILSDGTVLDAGWDHNACFRISPQIRYREDFTLLGNVRFSDVSLEFGKYPTSQQLQMVRMYCEYHSKNTIGVDFLGGKNGRVHREYIGLDFVELSEDLYNYYAGRNLVRRDDIYEAVEPSVPSSDLLVVFEQKYNMELSSDGKKWFNGILKNSPFGMTMDKILFAAVFQMLGMEPFPIGQDVGNEWDEMDGILRIIIQKTGYGEKILDRLRNSMGNRNIVSDEEMAILKKKLQYYPDIYKEFERCYYLFSKLAPAIYKVKNYLKNYKNGIPALEFCFLVGVTREKERAALKFAVNKVLSNTHLLPSLQSSKGLNENIVTYHGTSADFDHFDLAYVLTGWGQMDWGYGVYLSDRFETAKEYSGGHLIYTAEVPDGKYLDSEYINSREAVNIAREFYEYYAKKDEYGKEAYAGVEKEFWDNECKYIGEAPNGVQVYNTISSIIGDDKKASEYLYSKGYVGLRIESDFAASGEKFHNYVIFNPDDIKIIKKEQL